MNIQKILIDGSFCLRTTKKGVFLYARYRDYKENIKVGKIGEFFIQEGDFYFRPININLSFESIKKLNKIFLELYNKKREQ